jgi:hypothetical protein
MLGWFTQALYILVFVGIVLSPLPAVDHRSSFGDSSLLPELFAPAGIDSVFVFHPVLGYAFGVNRMPVWVEYWLTAAPTKRMSFAIGSQRIFVESWFSFPFKLSLLLHILPLEVNHYLAPFRAPLPQSMLFLRAPWHTLQVTVLVP